MVAEKHLEFVQQIIARMAGNSFLLKGWSVTLTAGLFALAAKDTNRAVAAIAVVPVTSFWILDAFYLRQERLFKALYDHLRVDEGGNEETDDRFSLDTSGFRGEVPGVLTTLVSPSVVGLHGVLVLAISVVLWLFGS